MLIAVCFCLCLSSKCWMQFKFSDDFLPDLCESANRLFGCFDALVKIHDEFFAFYEYEFVSSVYSDVINQRSDVEFRACIKFVDERERWLSFADSTGRETGTESLQLSLQWEVSTFLPVIDCSDWIT